MKRPDNGFAHYNLGKVLDESGSPLEAIEQYRESIQCDPTRSAPYDNLGKTLSDLGRLPEAVEQCQAALRINPNDSIAHDNLGRTFLKMGRKAEARDQFYDVSLLHPDDVEARDNLGGVLLELGQTKEAIAQLLAALRINPHLFETHYMLGNAYMLLEPSGGSDRPIRGDPAAQAGPRRCAGQSGGRPKTGSTLKQHKEEPEPGGNAFVPNALSHVASRTSALGDNAA